MSNNWKPKTSGLGEHDFMFNVPPPSVYEEKPNFSGEQSIKKYPEDIFTNWESRWFSQKERDSVFIFEWTVYKSDPPRQSIRMESH